MKRISALLLLFALAACSSTTQEPLTAATSPASGAPGASVTLTAADRAAVESAVRTRLGQPGATFRTMIAQRDVNAVVVCGYVNPGAGDTPFFGMLSAGAFTVADIGGPTERTLAVQKACHGRGIYI